MKWSKSLMIVTAFSYFTALTAASLGYPANVGVPASLQAFIFGAMGVFLLAIALGYKPPHLNVVLACIYGVLAALSFSGIQVWIDYSGSGASLGPWMALWDLSVAVALLDEV